MSKPDYKFQTKDDDQWEKMCAEVLIFIRRILTHPDKKEAKKLVIEQANLVWKKFFGAALEQAELDVKAMESVYAESCDIRNSLMKQLSKTKPYIPAAKVFGEGDNNYIPFSKWLAIDKVILILSVSAASVVLTMGAANVYANILGSGNPIFIERPALAFVISLLLPASSLAMEFVSGRLESDRSKAIYNKSIYALMVLTLLAWTVLFSLNFHGLSPTINLESLGKSNPASSALTWIQLLAEMLVGFVFCHEASDTCRKYAPNAYKRNPEFIEAESALKVHAQSNDALKDKLILPRGIVMKLSSSCQLFTNEMLALYLSMRGRFDDTNPM